MRNLIALLATLGQIQLDNETLTQRRHLEECGWICLGEEAGTGVVHWTNLERGLTEGGPVSFYHAVHLQKTEDVIARRTGV